LQRTLAVLISGALAAMVAAPAASSSGPDPVPVPAASAAPCLAPVSLLAYPPYDPEKNYCGPEWLQDAGYGALVPREPESGFDFSPACYAHDACYDECCQNQMSQSDCDEQFRTDLKAICDTRGAEMQAQCSGLSYWVCRLVVLDRVTDCRNMADTYADAVAYLGDGVVELWPFWLALLGPVLGYIMWQLIPTWEIEAAYPCPCACVECPPDQPVGNPICVLMPPTGAFMRQTVIRHEKQGSNVSGVGPVCECVASTVTLLDPCPAGGCAPGAVTCAAYYCDPVQCERSVPLGGRRCELRPDDGAWVVVEDYEEWYCRDDGPGRQSCRGSIHPRALQVCPAGCAGDGVSCAPHPGGPLTLRLMQPAGFTTDELVPCAACWIRLHGVMGTFEGTTGIDGTVTFDPVAEGGYVIWYGCGPDGAGPHLPSDIVGYPGHPDNWVFAHGPFMNPESPLPIVVTPVAGVVEVIAGYCPLGHPPGGLPGQ